MQPLRQWPRLKSDPLHRKTKRRKESNQSFGFTRDLRLPDNLALRVHNAHAREFQCNIDSGIVLHGCSPSPDAWGRLNVVTPFHHLSEDSHINCPLRAAPITASSHLERKFATYRRALEASEGEGLWRKRA